jgi:hypothetical protein
VAVLSRMSVRYRMVRRSCPSEWSAAPVCPRGGRSAAQFPISAALPESFAFSACTAYYWISENCPRQLDVACPFVIASLLRFCHSCPAPLRSGLSVPELCVLERCASAATILRPRAWPSPRRLGRHRGCRVPGATAWQGAVGDYRERGCGVAGERHARKSAARSVHAVACGWRGRPRGSAGVGVSPGCCLLCTFRSDVA